jgi:hypothetical protein
MTATPPVDRAATSRLIATLEHAWAAIRTQHPEVPQVVIVVASGSDPAASSCIGPPRRRPLATHRPA